VSSALGVGSVFTLRLPVSVLSSAAPVDRGQLPGDSSAISVLVLEGNPFNRCLVEACCAEQGLAVSTVDTLDAAIETLEVRRFEFVVVAADALPLAAGEAMGALMSISDAAGDARLIVRIGEEVALEAPAARLCGADEVLIGAFDADEFLKAIAAGDANSQRANAA
jgi:ActR/RegA family two-component response regulator